MPSGESSAQERGADAQSRDGAAAQHLTPDQSRRLREALVQAYPTLDDLTMFVSDRFGKNLEAVTSTETLDLAVFGLIRRAEAETRTHELVREAAADRPTNSDLQALARELAVKITAMPGGEGAQGPGQVRPQVPGDDAPSHSSHPTPPRQGTRAIDPGGDPGRTDARKRRNRWIAVMLLLAIVAGLGLYFWLPREAVGELFLWSSSKAGPPEAWRWETQAEDSRAAALQASGQAKGPAELQFDFTAIRNDPRATFFLEPVPGDWRRRPLLKLEAQATVDARLRLHVSFTKSDRSWYEFDDPKPVTKRSATLCFNLTEFKYKTAEHPEHPGSASPPEELRDIRRFDLIVTPGMPDSGPGQGSLRVDRIRLEALSKGCEGQP